eukprot:scaffold5075_cov25-Cyclotella_meneghiniana.AAC.1
MKTRGLLFARQRASLIGLPPVEPDLYKDSHPHITYKNAALAFKGNSLDRYLMGRQFTTLNIVIIPKANKKCYLHLHFGVSQRNKVHMVSQDNLRDTLVYLLSDVSLFARRYASAALFTLAFTIPTLQSCQDIAMSVSLILEALLLMHNRTLHVPSSGSLLISTIHGLPSSPTPSLDNSLTMD